tara:strand:+ start:1099 stop:1446 length:348 start_codon:yes stop_codon:yes gene_type:complete
LPQHNDRFLVYIISDMTPINFEPQLGPWNADLLSRACHRSFVWMTKKLTEYLKQCAKKRLKRLFTFQYRTFPDEINFCDRDLKFMRCFFYAQTICSKVLFDSAVKTTLGPWIDAK